jgi:hypothetical protein
MANKVQTISNIKTGKFQQNTGETVNLSGTTYSYGRFEYAGSAPLNPNSRTFTDRSFVTGITTNLLTKANFNIYSASTLTNINSRLLTTAFNTYSAATLTNINSRLLTTAFNTYSASTLTNINSRLLTTNFNVYSAATLTNINSRILTANNGLNKIGTNVRLGGNLTGTTTIGLGTNNLIFTGTTGTLRYGSNLSAQFNIRSLVDVGYVTGLTSTLGIQTANNGLTKNSLNVRLGGNLTGATTIGLGTNNLILSGTTGTLRYNSNLSAQYNVRTLVDVGYVTGITSTLGIQTANNGLNKVGLNVRLGGALTGNTNINLNTFALRMTGATGTLTMGSSRFAILNPANTFSNVFVSSAIVANRNVIIPLLTADDTLVTAAFTQTLTNKTLTAPRFATNGFIADSNGVAQLSFILTTTAVNGFAMQNAISANNPIFSVIGTATNIGFNFQSKGTGVYRFLGTATKSAEIQLSENTTGGTNFTGFRAPVNLTGDTMYVLPNRLPSSSGQVLSSLTDGTMSWSSVLTSAAFNTFTGTTLPATYQTRASINVLTGTTLPATYLSRTAFNTYSATTLTNINSRLLTTNFNVYSADTLSLIQASQAGLDPKQSVRVATTANFSSATYNPTGGVSGTGQFTSAPTSIDGVTLATGNRILVKNQTDAKQNGIYSVISSGTWNRATDQDGTPTNEVSAGNYTFVETGSTNIGTGWVTTGMVY